MASMNDFHKAYKKLIETEPDKFSKDRTLKMEKDSWKPDIYYTAYIAGNYLTNRKCSISDDFDTPMKAVEDVLREVKEKTKEVQNGSTD